MNPFLLSSSLAATPASSAAADLQNQNILSLKPTEYHHQESDPADDPVDDHDDLSITNPNDEVDEDEDELLTQDLNPTSAPDDDDEPNGHLDHNEPTEQKM